MTPKEKREKIIEINGQEEKVRQEHLLRFQNDVEALVADGDIGYIEAVGVICERENIDVDTVSNLISAPLQSKLTAEACSLNLLVDPNDNTDGRRRRRRQPKEIKLFN